MKEERKPLKLDDRIFYDNEYSRMIRSFLDNAYVVDIKEGSEHFAFLDLGELRQQLNNAVACENYELAAEIRDEINGRN